MNNLKQNWLQLTAIQAAGAFSLPVILVGYFLATHYYLPICLTQLLLGNISLFVLALFYIFIISQKKMVTIEFSRLLFGIKGNYFCAVGIALSLVGWTGIQLNMINDLTSYKLSMAAILGLLIGFVSFNGLFYISKLCKLLLPILFSLFLCFLYTKSSHFYIPTLQNHIPFHMGLMLVITVACNVVFDLPTFFVHARSFKDALKSVVILFLFILPGIEGLGILLAYLQNIPLDLTLVQQMKQILNVPLLTFLIISGLLSSTLNLYSATIALVKTFKFNFSIVLYLLFISASILAGFNIIDHLNVFLEFISLTLEIMFIMILLYFIESRFTMPFTTVTQQKRHCIIFYSTFLILSGAKILSLSLFNDLFIDTLFLVISLMTLSYLFFPEVKHASRSV